MDKFCKESSYQKKQTDAPPWFFLTSAGSFEQAINITVFSKARTFYNDINDCRLEHMDYY